MAASPPVLLLFDLSALMAGQTREWQEYSRVGECWVPQVVLEEVQFLTGRAPEPDLEKTAREFSRFYPDSGWQAATANATHASFQPPSGEALSKKARLSIAVAQAAYGLAQERPDHLVVLVANDQPLLKRIQAVNAPNLTGVTATGLLQWSRTQQRPVNITQKLQGMGTSGTLPTAAVSDRPRAMANPAAGQRSPAPTPTAQARAKPVGPGVASQLISGLLALLFLAIAGLIGWRILSPASFNQFWQQLGLPALPGQQTAPKPKGK